MSPPKGGGTPPSSECLGTSNVHPQTATKFNCTTIKLDQRKMFTGMICVTNLCQTRDLFAVANLLVTYSVVCPPCYFDSFSVSHCDVVPRCAPNFYVGA